MLTLKDLSKRYRLTPKQARRWWDAVSPLLDHHAQRGPHNVILVSEQGIPVFDRLAELVREGLSLPAAAERLREELNGSGQVEGEPSSEGGQSPTSADPRDELIAILKEQLREKDKQIAALLSQLEDLQRRALPPAGSRRWRWPWTWTRARRGVENG